MTTPPPDLFHTAHELHQHGILVIPVRTDGTKAPALKAWQKHDTIPADFDDWFNGEDEHGNDVFPTHGALGVVTGPRSGNLEMLEVEGQYTHLLPELVELAEASGLGPLWHTINTGWKEASPSGGLHWMYKVDGDPVPGNTKLARDTPRQEDGHRVVPTIAETRGAGGQFVAAPTPGTAHTTGRPWMRLAGGPATVPTITSQDRHALHDLFRTLDHTPEHAAPSTPAHPSAGPSAEATIWDQLATQDRTEYTENGGVTPGDDYENRTDWADLLKPAGWTHVFTRGHTRYWRRPGKTEGISATTGNADDRDRFYVFTSSTDFEQETPYTKLGAYAVLHHGGNHSAAASRLRADGYGQEPTRTIPSPTRADLAYPSTPGNDPWNPAPNAATTTSPTTTAEPGAATSTATAESPTSMAPSAPATDGSLALASVTHLRPRDEPTTSLTNSDDGNSLSLIDLHGRTLRYCADRGRWLHWNGTRWTWQPSGGGIARELAKDTARRIADDPGNAAHKRRALSAKGTTDMLVQASTDPRVTIHFDDLDARPWELNTPTGILNLRTGSLEPSNPEHLHTRLTRCSPDTGANPEVWHQFLDTTFGNDPTLIGYMQRLIGYSATGLVREHILPFAHGSGGNGKGTFLESITKVLGDYATTSPNGFLMATNYAAHTTEIARLSGARMVLCSEVNQGDRFDEAKVKMLTGGDTLTARFMRQDDFTFTPTHHLWLMGNDKPAVTAGGNSFWRRLRLIPFERSFDGPDADHAAQKIEGLQDILADDHGPALLAWIAEGAAAYHRDGLQDPPQVKAATAQYAADVDTVGRFLNDAAELHPEYGDRIEFSTPTKTVRAAYEQWCHDNGERPLTGRAFTTQLAQHGITTGDQAPRTKLAKHYGGITLNAATDAEDWQHQWEGDR